MSGHPITIERWVAYWTDDLPPEEADAVEVHMMSCAECTEVGERVAAIARTVRALIPPVISQAEVDALVGRGLVVRDNRVDVGDRHLAVFEPGIDILLHRLSGMELGDAEAVDVVVRVENGPVLLESQAVPFDRARGEVLIACQRHYAVFPPEIEIEVTAREAGGAKKTARFQIPHAFPAP